MSRGFVAPAALVLLAVLAFAVPSAAALDVLPTESRLGASDARILVRAEGGSVSVRAEPPVDAGARGGALSATPTTLRADTVWHGIEGVVEIELRREDASLPVDVYLEDAGLAGAWIEWPAAPRELPVPGWLVVMALVAATWTRKD